MIYIYKDRIIRLEWTILKGTSHVKENFDRALVKLFLIGPADKYLLDATAENGVITATIPQGLPEGNYSVEVIYAKNWGNLRRGDAPTKPMDERFNDRCLMRSRKDDLFGITNYESEADNVGEGEVVVSVKSSVATYGYDGLNSYELAVIRGTFIGTESAFIALINNHVTEHFAKYVNSIQLEWNGSAYLTRISTPIQMRRKGLMISYVNGEGKAITEKCVFDADTTDVVWGLDSSWQSVEDLVLGGELFVSPNGTWVINGVDSGIKAVGPKGDNGLTPRLKTIDNKLHYSYDDKEWLDAGGEHIAAWFRWSGNKIQISRDNKTWTDLSGEFADNLFIKGYVATFDQLPADAVQGDIWGVGPTNADTNPTYRYYVRNAGGWVDNGEFTSIKAGIVQEAGDGENVVMSQKAVSMSLKNQSIEIVGNMFTIPGVISKKSGNIVTSEESLYSTYYLPIDKSNDIMIVGAANTDNYAPYAFYDEYFDFISSYNGESALDRTYIINKSDIPSHAVYIRCSNNSSVDESKIIGVNLASVISAGIRANAKSGYGDDSGIITQEILTATMSGNPFNFEGGVAKTTGLDYSNSSYVRTDYILLNHDCDIYASGANSASTGRLWFYDKDKRPISSYLGEESGAKYYDLYVVDKKDFPKNAVYFRCSASVSGNKKFIVINSSLSSIGANEGKIVEKVNLCPQYIEKVVGKNLLFPKEFLYGYSYSADSGYIQRESGIMSNKLRLSPKTYTIQGVRPFSSLVGRVCWFNDKDEYIANDKITLNEDGVGQLVIEAGDSKYYNAAYCRVLLQYNADYSFNVNVAQFEEGETATEWEECKTELVENPRYIRDEKLCLLTGASNAVAGNGWFENACEMLGYKHRNVAVSGESVMQHATKAWRGLIYNADGTLTNNVDADGNFLGLYTAEELEDIDVFVTSHTHNYDVSFEGETYTPIELLNGYYNESGKFTLNKSYLSQKYVVRANKELRISTFCKYSAIPYVIFLDTEGNVLATDIIPSDTSVGESVVDRVVITPNATCYMVVKTVASVPCIKVLGTTSVLKKTVQEYESVGYDENNNPLSVVMDKSNSSHRIVPYGGSGASGTLEPNNTINERYAAGYDYLLKKYAYDCYMLKFNPQSKWYGSPFGKPCNIVICSYWHDGYKVFNESAKILAKRHGALYCDIAGQVGFSYMQTDPTDDNSLRISRLYCNNSSGNEEDIPIDGVMYTKMGWHATRDVNSPLMIKRGKILSESLLIACGDK